MNAFLQIIALRFVPKIHRLFGRKRSRLNPLIATWCAKKPSIICLKTSDGLRWELDSGSYVDCLVAMEAEEPHILNFIAGLNLDGSTVVDMGANVGGLTLRFSKAVGINGYVVAYEPNPDAAARLKRNLILNNIENTEVLEKGVWSESGSFTLYVPAHGNSGTASLVDTDSNAGGKRVKVETETLDSRWKSIGQPHVRLVKIDIQGAEKEALRGMREMLGAHRPGLIIEVEGAGDNLPQRMSSLVNYLKEFGYIQAVNLRSKDLKYVTFDRMLDGHLDDVDGDFYFC